MAVDIVIYHNPGCGTSRNTLGLIRNAGVEPHVVEYLKTPPSRALLVELIDRAGITPRDLLREKGTPYTELGLGDTSLSDDVLVNAMMAHPILINRPLVVSNRSAARSGSGRVSAPFAASVAKRVPGSMVNWYSDRCSVPNDSARASSASHAANDWSGRA